MSQKVDGIIISAGPLAAAPAALKAAKDAGIPVVMVDRKLTGEDYTSWIGPDNEAIGKQDGEYIANKLSRRRQGGRDPRRPRGQHDRARTDRTACSP